MGSVVKRFDVVAGRKYQNRNGEDKTQWINCGEAVEWDNGGISLQLRSVPVGNWFDGSLKLFERDESRNKGAQSARAQSAPPSRDSGGTLDDDDIPFAPLSKHSHW